MNTPHSSEAFITRGSIKFLNVPHAAALVNEIFDEDCYSFDRIPPDTIVLDIGAFYGEFGIRCAVEKHCRVIAYEPSSENRTILELNRRLNDLKTENFVVSPLAIGTPGTRLFSHRSLHPAGSLLATEAAKHVAADIGTSSTYEVECVGILGEIQKAKDSWGDLPVCVKMDCEGAEHEIFANYADWIGQVSVIAMEWHNYDGDHFHSILAAQGFATHVEGGGPKPRPVWDPSIGAGLLFAVR